MLMVTTTVRLGETVRANTFEKKTEKTEKTYMVDGVHSNTTSLGPGVALSSELVLGTRCLCRISISTPLPSPRYTRHAPTPKELTYSREACLYGHHQQRFQPFLALGS